MATTLIWQFFFTFGDQSKLTGKHVGFGKLVGGEEVIGEDRPGTCHIRVVAILGWLPY